MGYIGRRELQSVRCVISSRDSAHYAKLTDASKGDSHGNDLHRCLYYSYSGTSRPNKEYFLLGEVDGKTARYEISMFYFRKLNKLGIWNYPYCYITYDPNIKAVLDLRVE